MSQTEAVPETSTGNIVRIIADRFPDLTAQERQAAQFIIEHLADVVVYTSAELAELSGVSGPTLSRLYRKLGFADATAFRHAARAFHLPGDPYLSELPSDRDRSEVELHLEAESGSLARTLGRLRPGQLAHARQRLTLSDRVVVVGERNAYPLALHLREQLLQLRAGVLLLPHPGQTMAEELVSIGASDTVVLFGLRRRPAGFPALLAALNARGVPTLLVADSTIRGQLTALPHPELVTLFEVELPTHAMLASFTAAASVVELLASLAITNDSGARIERIDAYYRDLRELETALPTPRSTEP